MFPVDRKRNMLKSFLKNQQFQDLRRYGLVLLLLLSGAIATQYLAERYLKPATGSAVRVAP
jgi:hypothetical protein